MPFDGPVRPWKAGLIVYALLAAVSLGPILMAIPYVFPTYDDYYYAFRTSAEGFWGVQAWWYLNASGRYLSNLLLSAGVVLIHHHLVYRVLLVLFLTILVVATHRMSTHLMRRPEFRGFPALFLSVGMLCFFLQVTPGFSEFLFWYTGAGTYSIGISLTLFFLTELFFKKAVGGRPYILLLTSLLAIGTIEFAGLFVAAGLVFHLYLSVRANASSLRRLWKSQEALVLIVVLGTLFFVIAGAEGNRVRFETEKVENSSAGNPSFALYQGVLGAVKFIYNIFWVRGGLFLFLTTFLSAIALGVGRNAEAAKKWRLWTDWLFAQSLLVGLTLLISVMYSYSTGVSTMIPRTVSVLSFFWSLNLMASAVLMAAMSPFLMSGLQRRWVAAFRLAPAAYLCFMVAIHPESNIHKLYGDLLGGSVSAYRDFQIRQTGLFEACDIQGLEKLRLPEKPMTFVWDISDGNMGTRYFQYYREGLCGKHMQGHSP